MDQCFFGLLRWVLWANPASRESAADASRGIRMRDCGPKVCTLLHGNESVLEAKLLWICADCCLRYDILVSYVNHTSGYGYSWVEIYILPSHPLPIQHNVADKNPFRLFSLIIVWPSWILWEYSFYFLMGRFNCWEIVDSYDNKSKMVLRRRCKIR